MSKNRKNKNAYGAFGKSKKPDKTKPTLTKAKQPYVPMQNKKKVFSRKP